jgi:hypothetical protein
VSSSAHLNLVVISLASRALPTSNRILLSRVVIPIAHTAHYRLPHNLIDVHPDRVIIPASLPSQSYPRHRCCSRRPSQTHLFGTCRYPTARMPCLVHVILSHLSSEIIVISPTSPSLIVPLCPSHASHPDLVYRHSCLLALLSSTLARTSNHLLDHTIVSAFPASPSHPRLLDLGRGHPPRSHLFPSHSYSHCPRKHS